MIETNGRPEVEIPPHLDRGQVEQQAGKLSFVRALDFINENPEMTEPIVEGLFRRGETVNVIGSTKEGKSWLILGLALSVATGRPWLGRQTTQGRVALIDNELQPGTLSNRLQRVAAAMDIPHDVLQDDVEILPLRGRLAGIAELQEAFEGISDTDIALVGLDAFYRFIPSGVSENDNAAMAGIYNTIDRHASMLDAAFVLNHHTTKGEQTSKRITDVGSGAGSISRAADTHLIIRAHKKPELAVLDAACRSFPPVEPASLRYEFPLWSTSDEEAELKQRRTSGEAKKETEDKKGKDTILAILDESENEWLIRTAIRKKAGMGADRCNRLLRELLDSHDIESTEFENPRNKSEMADYFRRVRQ